jgi:transcriptional regulator with XRE-family HTH domain
MTLAQTITRRRIRLGMTMPELRDLSGISLGALSKLESGKHTNPTIKTVKKLAKALNLRPEKLLGD